MNLKPYIVGAVTGITEVFVTHPIDVAKTKSQVKHNMSAHPFRGMLPRLVGIIPMRTLFWGVQYDLYKRGYHPILAGAAAGLAQTLVDAPIENMKVSRIFGRTPDYFKGFPVHSLRNIGFAVSVACFTPYYLAPVGAILGTVLTPPLDTLKTSIQSGYPRRSMWAGLFPRTLQAVAAMAIGQILFVVASQPKYIKAPVYHKPSCRH